MAASGRWFGFFGFFYFAEVCPPALA